ncbi:hypothetical protein NC652_012093 [Populus alba x Populus x berolinensis]|nr:hypothetical protein NC652_012093 [Populus alba x Populus x berolinensis]
MGYGALQFQIRRTPSSIKIFNWGTESYPEFKYHNGNSEPRGFGNIGVTCERFERLGMEFVKKNLTIVRHLF